MQKRFHKYFWSGVSPLPHQKGKDIDKLSPVYKLKRIIEYAGFPDLIKYPFSEFKNHIDEIPIHKLWTGAKRKQLIKALLPFIKDSDSWDELFSKYINSKNVN